MVVVAIQSADGRNLFGAFQLSTLETIFTTGVGLQGQTDVRPQLTLGAKAMWCLYARRDTPISLGRGTAARLTRGHRGDHFCFHLFLGRSYADPRPARA